MDVYVKIYHEGKCFRSKTIARGGTDFKFKDEVFFLNVDNRYDDISLEVYGEDSNKDELIGTRKLELSLFTNGTVNKWFAVHSLD
jgi:Ca2+-dependent lipid-binding protein